MSKIIDVNGRPFQTSQAINLETLNDAEKQKLLTKLIAASPEAKVKKAPSIDQPTCYRGKDKTVIFNKTAAQFRANLDKKIGTEAQRNAFEQAFEMNWKSLVQPAYKAAGQGHKDGLRRFRTWLSKENHGLSSLLEKVEVRENEGVIYSFSLPYWEKKEEKIVSFRLMIFSDGKGGALL